MKYRTFLACLFLFFFSFLCYARDKSTKGVDLCDALFSLCKDCGMSPKKETIISSIPNNFPYNITLDKKGNCNDQNISNSTLLLIFSQEEVFEKPDTFINILLELSESTYNFDIKILLSYDGDLNLGNRNITKGSKMFLDSIGNGQTYTTIFINLNHDADRILPGSKGYNAPTWLVKNSYKAFKDHKLLGIFNFGYISYLYKQNLFNEDLYSDWLEAGIPSISIFFDKKTSGDIITDTISQIISDFNPEINISSDTHSIMIPLIKNQVWLSESLITRIILITVFLSLFILFSFGFLNRNQSKLAWKLIKKIWYFPLLFYGISILVFIMYKYSVNFLREKLNCPLSLLSSISFILPMIFVVLSLVFLSTIRYSPDFKRKTIDYITMITSTINLYIFSLIDISLFPIFAVEFILASLSVVFKKNYFHFIILILFEIPFVPYLFQFLYNSDFSQISESLMNNIFLPFAIFLIIIPQYLTVFRILKGTSFFFYKKTKNPAMKDLGNLLLIAIFCVIFEAVIIFLLPENFSKTKKTNPSKIINKSPEKILKIETKTRHIFGDRIRTLKIDSDKPLEYCIIRVEGKDSTPVLFSENDYYAENATVCIFKTPFEPPSKMEFNYGEGKTETNITVTAIYEENGNIYMDYYSVIQEDF